MTIYSQFLPSFLQCCHTFYYIATTFAIGSQVLFLIFWLGVWGLTNNPLHWVISQLCSHLGPSDWSREDRERKYTMGFGSIFLEPQLHQLDRKLPIIKFCFLWILFTRHWHQHHHHGSAWGLKYQTTVEIKEKKKQNKTMLCSVSEH